jgi:hypothetical protein
MRAFAYEMSLRQILDVWGDLVAAYHGVNGYGSDTAEIHACDEIEAAEEPRFALSTHTVPLAEPSPREWWTVAPLLTDPSKWLCVRVWPGGLASQLSPCPRATEAAAREDGERSGLEEWQPSAPPRPGAAQGTP